MKNYVFLLIIKVLYKEETKGFWYCMYLNYRWAILSKQKKKCLNYGFVQKKKKSSKYAIAILLCFLVAVF